ncbi:MAG: peptidyl-prolyl cis-trans isomerase [Cyclobacteriaceae bacterium]|nr:peptidyl-prolyl cis-trans isomerase [Cyclobacteriaceae bacterium]
MSCTSRTWICLLLVALNLGGCELIRRKNEEPPKTKGPRAVARVNDVYLYETDLSGIVDNRTSREDSMSRVTAYVNSWIRKQLIIQEATRRMNIDEAEVERKVLDYRYSLIGYEYQNFYIRQHLDENISLQEITDYYNTHQDNFALKQNIVQGTFIKVPRTAPRTNKVKDMIFSKKPKDLEELRSYCLSFSTAYHLSDSLWIEFDKLVVNSPIAEIPNKIQFLKTNPYYETSDENYLYFLKIDNYKISDNVSPLEFVKEDIRNILLNKRKVELARALEDEVYENAVKQKNFEIFDR